MKNKNAKIAISEIFILLVGTIAFAYLLGGQVGFVSGVEEETPQCSEGIVFEVGGVTNYKYKIVSSSLIRQLEYSTEQPTGAVYNYYIGGWRLNSEPTLSSAFQNKFEEMRIYWSNQCNSPQTINPPAPIIENDAQSQGNTNKAPATTNAPTNINLENLISNGLKSGATGIISGNAARIGNNLWGPNNSSNNKDSSTTSTTGEDTTKKRNGLSTFYGSVIGRNVVWAGITQGVLFGIESILRYSKETHDLGYDVGAAHWAVEAGTFVGVTIVYGAVEKGSTLGSFLSGKFLPFFDGFSPALSAGLWGVGTALLVYELMHEDKTTIYTFSCYAWQAPEGGSNCDVCNNQDGDLPCTEYQCRSLGQSCELINKGTDDEKCVWLNRDDVNPPQIRPWNNTLLNEDYTYDPIPSEVLSPPDIGVEVFYNEGNIPAFTPLSFGITVVSGGNNGLPEPAICKVDFERKTNFDDMRFYLSDGLAKYNHSYQLSLPSLEVLESSGIILQNGGVFDTYVRCKDSNGNQNAGNFVFRYTVDDGPDTTPPIFRGNSFLSTEAPIAYNTPYVDNMVIYVNEPSECKWSHRDQNYDDMEGELTCDSVSQIEDLREVYACAANLTGLKNGQNNDFYFRCRDQPYKEDGRNTNVESYHINLIGTQPLVITSAYPNDTLIKDASNPIKVTLEVSTTAGYNEGNSICYFSENGENYAMFFYSSELGGYFHSQELWLQGNENGVDYNYNIRCIDDGGNIDEKSIEFTVQTDNSAPIVTRVYHEENYLKVRTSEPATCVYDVQDCTYEFDEGISMTSVEEVEHFTNWNTASTYYIKCKDEYGNQPNPNSCSIVARPSLL